MSDRPYAALTGEQLRKAAKQADSALGSELDRLQLTDERFRRILLRSLALEAEIAARKNK